MKPPICSLCKNPHWPRNPHRWDELPDDLPALTSDEMASLSPVDPKELSDWSSRAAETLGPAVPDPPRSNARSESHHTQDTDTRSAEQAQADRQDPHHSARSGADDQSRDIPDTAPSAEELRSMSNEELRLRYNRIMAEVMHRRRAKQKEPT
jgi:hypothetical protein